MPGLRPHDAPALIHLDDVMGFLGRWLYAGNYAPEERVIEAAPRNSAGLFALLPFVIHGVLMAPLGLTPGVVAFDAGLALLCWVIAVRVLGWRSRAEDHRTYLLFTYWYCLALLSTLVVL